MDAINTRHDALMFHALSVFPEELEGKFLDTNEFRDHFKDFHGRPVQDIVEALRHYGKDQYFKAEVMLSTKYLKHGNALDQVTLALNKLQPDFKAMPDKYKQVGKQVYAKVLAAQPLTIVEVSNLPEKAKQYLKFKFLDIDRQRLRMELAIYNDNTFIHPSRLVKNTHSEPATSSMVIPTSLNLHDVSLKPESYDKYNGVLHLAPFHARAIAGKTGVKRPKSGKKSGSKYMQCWILERIFKSVNTLNNGVEISSILGVNKNNIDKRLTKKIENAKTEINKKVAKDNGLKKLLIIDGTKIKVDKSYL